MEEEEADQERIDKRRKLNPKPEEVAALLQAKRRHSQRSNQMTDAERQEMLAQMSNDARQNDAMKITRLLGNKKDDADTDDPALRSTEADGDKPLSISGASFLEYVRAHTHTCQLMSRRVH
jgi:tellurite resistance protein